MLAPPEIVHQRIAQNLTRLLEDAPDGFDDVLTAIQTPGVDLRLDTPAMARSGRASTYVPEPDIAVTEDLRDPERRIVSAAVLLVEIVSSTDEIVTFDGRPWVEVEASPYRCAPCRAVLVVERERVRVRLWERSEAGWIETTLSSLADVLELRCCGLWCEVRAVYAKTHLAASTGVARVQADPWRPPSGIRRRSRRHRERSAQPSAHEGGARDEQQGRQRGAA